MRRGIVVASKRSPVAYDGASMGRGESPRVALGGAPRIVAEQAAVLGAPLVASAHSTGDRLAAARHPHGVDVALDNSRSVLLHLIVHDPAVFDRTQRVLSSDWLWSALHSLWDSWNAPTFGIDAREAWASMTAFSDGYVRKLAALSRDAPEPVYVLHDYQLVCVPERLRLLGSSARALLVVHTAWPGPDALRCLPSYIRSGLLIGMLSATSVTFLARRWLANFVDCIKDAFPDSVVDPSTHRVCAAGRSTRITVAPLGCDPRRVRDQVGELPQELREWLCDRPLVVHYGRTNPIKNARRAVEAFHLAATWDSTVAEARMLVRVTPHHLHLSAHREYYAGVSAAVRRVNADRGVEAVRLVAADDLGEALASYARADAIVINSTIDGQNLTAFEAALINQRGASLILSDTCGAVETLGEAARVVSPFDIAEQADALVAALTTSRRERLTTAERLHELADGWTPQDWMHDELASVGIA